RKTSHKKDWRLKIYAAQLQALGVAFTDADLERHALLRSMRKQRFTPDLAYLEWAEMWLLRLQEANQRVQSYPEPAFSGVLGRFWLKVCWYVSTNLGWTAWRRFWKSPLYKSTWRGVRRLVFLYTSNLLLKKKKQ